MTAITRKLEFDAGHRVLGHETKCKHLHGHRYVAEITVSACGLDELSRVVDFGVVKQRVGRWIDEHWDHNMLLNPDDPLLDAVVRTTELSSTNQGIWEGKQPYIMNEGENPTAEVIAEHLYHISCGLLEESSLVVEHVRIYETPNCWADYGPKV